MLPVQEATILITGASAGIGEAIARRFAHSGHHLIITGRRAERLETLAHVLSQAKTCRVTPLVFDVQDRQAVNEALATVPELKTLDLLVNNAGLALGRSLFEEADIHHWETMVDTNVKGLLYVTRAVLPHLIARRSGHIINVGSIAGKEVYALGNVYCASKHAVDSLTKSMRLELIQHHIKVSAIHPGAVDTEFSLVRFGGDEAKAKAVYEGFVPLSGSDVADAVAYMAQAPAHVCVADMVLLPAAQASASVIQKN